MADPHIADDEQSEKLKAWWQQNGASVVTGAVVGIGIIVGVNWWRSHTAAQAENASALYEQMIEAQQLQRGDDARAIGDRLQREFDSTPYAGKASLLLAKVAYENKEVDTAMRHLQWAMEHAKEGAVRHAARLRLARVQLERGDTDAVAKLIQTQTYGGFESQYKELEGDLALARGDPQGAQAAYEAALEALPDGSRYADMLEIKRDHAIAEASR